MNGGMIWMNINVRKRPVSHKNGTGLSGACLEIHSRHLPESNFQTRSETCLEIYSGICHGETGFWM